MADGQVDLALMSLEHAPAGLRTQHLFNDRYVLISKLDHPEVTHGRSLKQFEGLSQVIVSLQGGDFTTPVDEQLAALGCKRNVVLSTASFLTVPEIVANSDLVAPVPERLVHSRNKALKVVGCPLQVCGFSVNLLWHDRNHGHEEQQWIRKRILDLFVIKSPPVSG